MAQTQINDILGRARKLLFDDGLRWGNDELLDWFNAAQNYICLHRPDACSVKVEFVCTASHEQELPADAIRLTRVFGNVGGSAIRYIDIDDLDHLDPNWQDDGAAADEVDMYAYVEKDPRRFYVYPAPTDGHKIKLSHSKTPARVDSAGFDFNAGTQTIGIVDTYADAVLDYILYRGFSKDADYANGARAQQHFATCNQSIGVKLQADTGTSPKNG